MILVVDEQSPEQFAKVQAGTFTEYSIWERAHIQEWVRRAPEVLGEELLVVTMEFDRFRQSADRLDLLAMDRRGNLVVVELKRDGLAGYADLQALRYAAMVSTMTLEKLLPYFVHYQRQYLGQEDANTDTAWDLIQEFVTEVEVFNELSNRPRIILCSENFSTELTTTVLWLNQTELDITCVRIVPYKVGNQIVIVPTKIIPLQEAKQYLIDIEQKEKNREQPVGRTSRPDTFALLVEHGHLNVGDTILLRDRLPSYVNTAVQADPTSKVFQAEVLGKQGKSYMVRWAHDEQPYWLMSLTQTVFQRFHPHNERPRGMQGGRHWQTVKGDNIAALADEVWAGLQTAEQTGQATAGG
jgi:hypothetical protein